MIAELREKAAQPVRDAAERVSAAVDRVGDGVGILVCIAVLALVASSVALVMSARVLREARAHGDP